MRRIALLAACNAVAALRLSRRQTLAGIAGVAPLVPANAYAAGNLGAALAVFSAANPTVSPFTGFYKDPEHLEGYRVIKADNYMGTLQVRGLHCWLAHVRLREYPVFWGALVATLTELHEPFGINDNLTIPLFSSIAMQLAFHRISQC